MQKFSNIFTLILIALFLAGAKLTDTPKPWVYNPRLPDEITVFGERVPLDDPEVRERVENELILMSRQEHLMLRYFKRAGRWFPLFDSLAKREGVPADIKYLAVVESGLDNLISPARATGFWQFLESTGKIYGLRIDGEVDERYDPEKAALAAFRYLKGAKNKFGSWAAAAGSYNMGIGGMENRIAAQRKSNYFDLLLPDETMKYVPRIAALKLIFENPAKYGYILTEDDFRGQVPYRVVEVTSTIPSLVNFAIENGTSLKTLRYLNPWLRGTRLTVRSGASYPIRLPVR
ncbi:MAG: lytic transglycosylase domain-containing protein [Ignavibacteriales bacterium]|nr:MAG: lytic transglycosylase domain-containing protein [Ignavibacteriaceae bacterium]MBW7874168.1 lytic transglycosylase domain-containing protein [Ignavibacteria bacterium]MCZ2142943.1 lytic transglycosylase domain-containing protein [Ignavibacteriales bacterium]OQY79224.1 MAG: hypothetical protein B6D45_01405 [Ignavibacteriales bacterium UTCHB3]MBV6444504.1 hypothetical protein [Ignavibacteriaceae bacterium]